MRDFTGFDTGNSGVEGFDKKHGPSVYKDRRIYFADGAWREDGPICVMEDAPTDPYERAKRIAIFYKITFERAVQAFDHLKNQIRTMCYANLNSVNCFAPSEGERATADLKVLQKKALDAKADYDKALAAIEAAKPEQHKKNELGQIRNQQANQALLSVVEAINV